MKKHASLLMVFCLALAVLCPAPRAEAQYYGGLWNGGSGSFADHWNGDDVSPYTHWIDGGNNTVTDDLVVLGVADWLHISGGNTVFNKDFRIEGTFTQFGGTASAASLVVDEGGSMAIDGAGNLSVAGDALVNGFLSMDGRSLDVGGTLVVEIASGSIGSITGVMRQYAGTTTVGGLTVTGLQSILRLGGTGEIMVNGDLLVDRYLSAYGWLVLEAGSDAKMTVADNAEIKGILYMDGGTLDVAGTTTLQGSEPGYEGRLYIGNGKVTLGELVIDTFGLLKHGDYGDRVFNDGELTVLGDTLMKGSISFDYLFNGTATFGKITLDGGPSEPLGGNSNGMVVLNGGRMNVDVMEKISWGCLYFEGGELNAREIGFGFEQTSRYNPSRLLAGFNTSGKTTILGDYRLTSGSVYFNLASANNAAPILLVDGNLTLDSLNARFEWNLDGFDADPFFVSASEDGDIYEIYLVGLTGAFTGDVDDVRFDSLTLSQYLGGGDDSVWELVTKAGNSQIWLRGKITPSDDEDQVPEPAAWALLLTGLAAGGFFVRRRNR